MNAGKILLADDDPTLLPMLAKLLRAEGYECDTVVDAPEAAEKLTNQTYDLLISDLDMPGNKGLRLIHQVPQIAAGLPVIIITAYPSVETAVQSLQLPVTAYLVKPLRKEELLSQVKRAIRHYRALCAVRHNRSRIEDWNQDLDRIERNLRGARGQETRTISALFDLTLRNIGEALADLRVFSEFTGESGKQPSASSRPLLLINALHEAIIVLNKTKGSFKSKELGDLRRKLEDLLGDGSGDDRKPADQE